MTNEEAIKKQVALLRKGYSIGIYPDYVPLMCNECALENDKFAYRNNLGFEEISLTRLGIPEPFHRASLIGFDTLNGPEWFIVDPTYGQFFENKKFRNYMFDNYKDFSLKLLNQGYIECTLPNMMYYINGFVFSNAYMNDIDSNLVYQKVEELLFSNVIVNKEVQETQKRLLKLLQLRAKIIQQSNKEISSHKSKS